MSTRKKTKGLESVRIFCLTYGDKPRVAALYPQYPDLVFAEPKGSRHLAHVTYLKKGARVDTNRAGIDYFLIAEGIERFDYGFSPVLKNITQKKLHPQERGTENRHGVHYKILKEFEEFKDVVRRVASYDIWNFHIGEKPPVIHSKPLMEIVQEIRGIQPKMGGYARIDGDFGKQAFEPNCVADLNLDCAKWCITEVTPFGIGGVVPEYKLRPETGCLICYNKYKHTGYNIYFNATRESLIKQIKELRKERADRGLPTRYLRIAKGTEMGHPLFRKQLLAALEASIEEELHAFMPTKFLEPDKEVAKRFIESDSTLLISLGNDLFEEGACDWRRTNDVRFEHGLWYLDQGVRTVPNVNANVLEEFGGPYYRERLLDALLNFPFTQILPVRIRKKQHAHIIGGWNNIRGEKGIDLFGGECGGCDVTIDHQRLFNYIHPSIQLLIGDNNGNVRMCHHSHSCSWCGKCFMPGEKGVITERKPPVITRDPHNIRPRRRREKYQEETLFDMNATQIKNGKETA